MKIVIVGAGKVGVALTRHLAVENRVTVIDQNHIWLRTSSTSMM